VSSASRFGSGTNHYYQCVGEMCDSRWVCECTRKCDLPTLTFVSEILQLVMSRDAVLDVAFNTYTGMRTFAKHITISG